MERRHRSRSGVLVVTLATAILMNACAVMDPYVEPGEDKFRESPTLANAVAYAQDTREQYYAGIRQHGGFNRFAGTSLIGLTAAALGLGITGGSTTTITELGLAGASLYGLSTWLELKPKMLIYQAGVEALNCTLAVYGPVRVVDTKELEKRLEMLPGELNALEAALRDARRQISSRKLTLSADGRLVLERAEIVLRNGRAAIEKGYQARGITARAGIGLYDATQGIRAQVTKGLIDAEGDLALLIASLARTIPLNAGLVTGKPFETPPDTTAKLSDPILNPVQEAADRVHESTVAIEKLVAGLSEPPSAETVSSCAHIDPVEAGFAFRTSPDSNVILDVNRADQPARIVLSGGKPSYHARWVNQSPPADVQLGVVDHDFGRDDEAAVTITVSKDSRPDTYELEVRDSGRGKKTLIVSVVKHAQQAGQEREEGDKGNGSGESRADPGKVRSLQTLLIDVRCLDALKADGRSNVDGVLGDATKAAIGRYLTFAEVQDVTANGPFGSTDQPDLDALVQNLMDLRKARQEKLQEDAGADVSAFFCPAPTG